MRLISCHIENFGKLTDCSLDFSPDFHMICEENGWGKSTFCAFIRAMFYGLEGERKRSIEENERKRYKPWQGGVFGGWLIFETHGKRYKVSRIFYDKESKDQFELRDASTNTLSGDYTKDLGKELFKINRDSFMRTVFIGQNSCETEATTDINARIGTLTDNSHDLNSYEAASARLGAIINKLTPSRMTGSLAKRREQIARLERIVQEGSQIQDSIETYEAYLHGEADRYEKLRGQIKEAGSWQTTVTKYQNIEAKREQWIHLKDTAAARILECNKAGEAFPGDIPSMEQIEEQLAACTFLDRAAERISFRQLNQQEKEELSRLRALFSQGVPGPQVMDEMLRSATQLRALRQEYGDEQPGPDEMSELRRLEPYWEQDREDISVVISQWNLRNTKKTALPSKQAALTALRASTASASRPGKGLFVLAGAGAVAVLLGIALLAFSQPVPGFSLAGAGVLLLMAGLLPLMAGLFSRRKKEALSSSAMLQQLEALEEAMAEDIAFIGKADMEVEACLRNHGREFDEATASSVLQMLMEESLRYSDLKRRYERSRNSPLSGQIKRLREKLWGFLEGYGISPEENRFTEDLYLLKDKAARLELLIQKEADFESASSSYRNISAGIRKFLEACGYTPGQDLRAQLESLRNSLDELQSSQRLYSQALADLRDFESRTDRAALEEIASEKQFSETELPSLEKLNQKILDLTNDMESCHHAISEYNKTLENLQGQYDEWMQNKEELNQLKELQKAESTKYEYILKAHEYLSRARESMTAKYAAPGFQAFCKYFESITGGQADYIHIDANMEVTVEQLGLQRELQAFSWGYRDLIGICLRAALVDAMYQEEAPVLIMDDPFTNLDDQKLPAAKRFLRELSKKYQIIYFTCSSSRGFSL